MLAIPLAVVAAEGLGWWWMRPAVDPGGARLLAYTFPGGRYGCVARPVAEKIEDMLHCDRGQTGAIQAGAGRMIDVNYFEWDDTDATGLADAFGHAPDVCMGNAGMKVEQFLPNRSYRLGDAELIFDSTLFREKSGAPLYIFKLSWAEGMAGVNLLRDGPRSQEYRKFKFKAVARRWRPRYARVLMLGVFGAANEEDAWKLARLNVLEELRLVNHPHHP
ncbi:MAG: hypothetical protein RLZZ214_4050 [Verrucomicrobiota bacterium]